MAQDVPRAHAQFRFLLPFWAVLAVFFFVVQYKHAFEAYEPVVWAGLFDKLLLDSLIFLLLGACVARWIPWRWPAALLITAYFFAFLLDAAIFYFGDTRFEAYHLGLITFASLNAFTGSAAAGFITAWLTMSAVAASLFTRSQPGLAAAPVHKLLFAILCLWFANAPQRLNDWLTENLHPEDHLSRFVRSQIGYQVSYLRANNFVRSLRELLRDSRQPVQTAGISVLEQYKDILGIYKLPLGTHEYEKLDIQPFRRVIFVTAESLSLDLMGPYNSSLPGDLFSFYSTPEAAAKMLRNFKTSATPTLQALTAIFNSHPNFDAFRSGKSFPTSFLPLLEAKGFRTIHLRGTSKFYGTENMLYRFWGFREFWARENFEKTEPEYVQGWGLMDRKLFDEAVRILKTGVDQKIFLHVLTIDTHPLDGRKDYGDLTYSPYSLPTGIPPRSENFFRSVVYHTQDMTYFLEQLKQNGLWTPETLLIITGDHCCPFNPVVKGIPGYPSDPLCRVPLLFLSAQNLPTLDTTALSSQLDLAPTIAHLLDLPIQPGWWGRSLFAGRNDEHGIVATFRNAVYLEHGSRRHSVQIGRPKSEIEKRFLELYNLVITGEQSE